MVHNVIPTWEFASLNLNFVELDQYHNYCIWMLKQVVLIEFSSFEPQCPWSWSLRHFLLFCIFLKLHCRAALKYASSSVSYLWSWISSNSVSWRSVFCFCISMLSCTVLLHSLSFPFKAFNLKAKIKSGLPSNMLESHLILGSIHEIFCLLPTDFQILNKNLTSLLPHSRTKEHWSELTLCKTVCLMFLKEASSELEIYQVLQQCHGLPLLSMYTINLPMVYPPVPSPLSIQKNQPKALLNLVQFFSERNLTVLKSPSIIPGPLKRLLTAPSSNHTSSVSTVTLGAYALDKCQQKSWALPANLQVIQ